MVTTVSTTTYAVRLIGRPDKPPKAVHWIRMKKFAGARFDINEQLMRTAVNDCQRFDVQDLIACRCNDKGDIELKQGALARIRTRG